jgi:hypothetical protein
VSNQRKRPEESNQRKRPKGSNLRKRPEESNQEELEPPPGAQLERTQLSWRRTLISLTAVALLLARLAAVHLTGTPAATALAAIALVWAAAVWLTRRRFRTIVTPVGRSLAALVTLILLYCAMATLLLMS